MSQQESDEWQQDANAADQAARDQLLYCRETVEADWIKKNGKQSGTVEVAADGTHFIRNPCPIPSPEEVRKQVEEKKAAEEAEALWGDTRPQNLAKKFDATAK